MYNNKFTIGEAAYKTKVPGHRINRWSNSGHLGMVETIEMGRNKLRLYSPFQTELITLIDKYRNKNTLRASVALAKSELGLVEE